RADSRVRTRPALLLVQLAADGDPANVLALVCAVGQAVELGKQRGDHRVLRLLTANGDSCYECAFKCRLRIRIEVVLQADRYVREVRYVGRPDQLPGAVDRSADGCSVSRRGD